MINKLSQIAGISTGYSFREKVVHEEDGDLHVIQMKDLTDNYQRIQNDVSRISSQMIPKLEKQLLNRGDVLFVSKGANNYASVFNSGNKAVAASVFFIIRVDQATILPDYLAWYINESQMQRYFEENRTGSYNPSVNKATLLNMPISLPSIKKQRLIASIDFLRRREYLLTNQLLEKRNLFISTKLIQNIKS